jgi:hypothetical protein
MVKLVQLPMVNKVIEDLNGLRQAHALLKNEEPALRIGQNYEIKVLPEFARNLVVEQYARKIKTLENYGVQIEDSDRSIE